MVTQQTFYSTDQLVFFVVDFFLLCSSTKDDDYDESKFQQHISLEDLYC